MSATRWMLMEDYLIDLEQQGVKVFDVPTMAHNLGVSSSEASKMVQAYLEHQTRPDSGTVYVLSRTGRTSSSKWHIGHRKLDFERLHRQTAEDFMRRALRFVVPTMDRMGNQNRQVRDEVEAVVDALMSQLRLMAVRARASVPAEVKEKEMADTSS